MATVRVRISPDGTQVIVEAHGCPGPACETLLRPFEAVGELAASETTAEYYHSPVLDHEQELHLGDHAE